ncbi:ABC transporter permease [Lentibacillus sp. CBA3610]|uniref:ABC transporter permease n=1 Tax=Lentibacillus sp. CBA3610 TaxID=2518176 RepID=UPI001595B66B|nr:ABC transporter permease [Lentibacillus sp. CBA3610]QKY71294.1 ABC transporter permease [Lentibacillus sp. CBA3610]
MSNLTTFSFFQLKLLMRGYKDTAIGFFLPVAMFIIFSNVFAGEIIEETGFSLVDYLLPAFILIIIINAVIVIYGQYYSVYKEQGNLLKYRLLGLDHFTISIGILLPTLIFQFVAIMLLVITAIITSDVPIPIDNILSVVTVIGLVNLFQYSLAAIIFTVTSKSAGYQSVALLFFFYQMFLGGLTFPPEMFPDSLETIVEFLNPIYYALIAFRGVWTEGEPIYVYYQELSIIVIVTIVLLLIGYILTKKKRVIE